MPTRKQRRRRRKSFRHEYEYVLVDEDGNEVEAGPEESGAEKGRARAVDEGRASAKPKSRTPARAGRVIQPPSWRRVARRGLMFAPLMFVAISILDHDQPIAFYAVQTIVLLVFFLPFSYVMDVMAYRMYLKRTGAAPTAPDASRRKPKPQSAPRSPR